MSNVVSEIEIGKYYKINTKKFREIYPDWISWVKYNNDYRIQNTTTDEYTKVIFNEKHDTQAINLLLKNNLVEEL